MRPTRSLLALLFASTTAIAACDGTTGPVLTPDGGPPDTGRPDGGPPDGGPEPDGGPPPDVQPPTIVSTAPADGATGVGADVSIAVTFSEEMAPVGTIRATADGVEVALGAIGWDATGTIATVTPVGPLPSESRVRVTIESDFEDPEGNPLALPRTITFDVGDVVPPTVVSSDPAQGATDLSARMDTITISFSEPMDGSVGTLSLGGGTGTLGAPVWLDARTMVIPVSGLVYSEDYELSLDGFADAAGNALDETVYLVGGAIAFTVGADLDAPRVADSVPSEGQVNVALRGTPSIVIVFDEAMDPTVGTATLHTIAGDVVLAGTWSDGDTRLTLPVAGRLYSTQAHAVELAGFEDAAGNALDTITYLEDGRLDFDTGADVTVPVVVFSYPNEGSSDADHRLARIEIAFDRAMGTDLATLTIDDGVASFAAPVTWNLAGTRAYADVTDRIHAGRSYRVDLRGLVDLAGDPLDPSAPYLGDGVLDFTTRAPTGEQCRDELRITEATGRTAGGGYEWVIPETSMATIDNGPACRYTASGSISPDAVILYRKTTAAGSSGGRYLHVTAELPTVGNRLTLAVYRDACGQASPGGPTARLTCQWDRYRWEQYLDVGAGDYYVWVASSTATTQRQMTVRVEEVDAVPAGESCASPLTAAAGVPGYTPPTTPDGEHVWSIAQGSYEAADMDDAWPGEGAMSCDADQVQGTDVVVAVPKLRADSLVDVLVASGTTVDSAIYDLEAAARTTCDPQTGTELACAGGMQSTGSSPSYTPTLRRFTVGGPAGSTYVWIANEEQDNHSVGATVRAREIDASPGTSCATAIPLPASGVTAIAPTSPARFAAPACMETGDRTDGVTWYRLTTTARATVLRANAASATATGAVALIDAASGAQLACASDATQIPISSFLAPGADVCVAVRNGSSITQLDVRQLPYAGVQGVATDLAITRPLNTSGAEIVITSDNWMVATPTTLYMAITSGLVIAPRSGSARADLRSLASNLIGSAGASIGEAVWSLDDLATAGTTSRLARVVDAAGAPTTTAWDTGTSWPADAYDSLAYDGTSFYVANDWATSVPVAIRRLDPAAPAAAVSVGAIHTTVRDTLGLAADATWFYFAGVVQVDATTTRRGVFRIRRTQLGTAAPEQIATLHLFSSTTGTTLVARVPMAVDSTAAATYLYVRAGDGHVHVIADPGGASPQHLGAISALGDFGDFAMAYDASGPSIFLFETETTSNGRFVRLD